MKDVRECNKVLEYALRTSEEGIFYATEGIELDKAIVFSISDASFGNEEVEVTPGVHVQNRSQQGVFICSAPADVVNAQVTTVHPINWSTTVIKSVCRATSMAETTSMIQRRWKRCKNPSCHR